MLNKKLSYLLIICLISFFLLTATTPIFSLLWLLVPTGYFLYNRDYRDILKIWGFTIGIWYFIFTTSLSEITIVIGFENTKIVIDYLLNNPVMFENLCFQTVDLLDFLSAELGFPLYIPAVINIFSFLSKLFANDRPKCSSNEDESKKSSSWWGKPKKKSSGEETLDKCKALEQKLRESRSIVPDYQKSESTTDGKTTTIYRETWDPFFGTRISCTSREATKTEKDAFNEHSK